MPQWKFPRIEEQGPAAVVTSDRGEALNAFNEPVVRELTEVAGRAREDIAKGQK